MRVIFDLETNGFLSDATKIHSIVIKDIDTKQVFSYHGDKIGRGLYILSGASLLVGHNILKFDLPVIEKLYPEYKIEGEVFDTLLVSRLIWTNRKELDFQMKELPLNLAGRHSLESWGYRLGLRKGDYAKENDFSVWTPAMQTYCERDVEVTYEFFKLIEKQNYSTEAIKLEHDFARCIYLQEAHGFHFDVASAKKLYASLANRRLELEKSLVSTFPNWKKYIGTFIPKRDNKTLGYKKGVPIKRYKELTFNPNSRDHISDRLMNKGWKPREFTPDGKPKVDESVLSKLIYPEAKLLAEHFLIQKRIGQLAEGNNAWLKLQRDGILYGSVITNGANTGRCTHQKPNVAQTPSVGVPYGKECRSLFTVPNGFQLIGCDASGLELRCLAHYIGAFDEGSFTKQLLHGDIHTYNQKQIGLPTRDLAKRVIYGCIYGIGDTRLGAVVGKSSQEGKRIKAKLFEALPALKQLRDNVIIATRNKKYLLGLDKRKLIPRSEHSSLNLLIQSCGALIIKMATVILHKKLEEKKYDKNICTMVAHVHDELQLQCKSDYADEVGKIAVQSIKDAGTYFNLRCPLDAEYKIGNNWASTH
jgi:DNA polymerase I-like protein with 3'-5' exonuclease and polymerase domains